MTTPTSEAIAEIDNSPKALVQRYGDSFAAVLPQSVIPRPETWIRIAQGALKKGKRVPSGETELELAAKNNPGVFLAALLDAARMGLEPGTEQYYLTPRKVKDRLEILGIVGYQGYVEMMYRAGFVSSVVVEVVREQDHFQYSPGKQEIPDHEIDWDADDRGDLRLVYAYARMKSGGFSKVVVLNRGDINRIKAKAQGAGSEYSPWQTDPQSMWMKSAVRQLRKWVPTSAEQRGVVTATIGPVEPITATAPTVVDPNPDLPPIPDVSFEDDDEIVDAELVDDNEPAAASPPSVPTPVPPADGISAAQVSALKKVLRAKRQVAGPACVEVASEVLGRPVASLEEITLSEFPGLLDTLQGPAEDDAA